MTILDPKNFSKSLPMTKLKDYVDTAPTSTDNIAIDTRGWRFAKIILLSGTLTGGTGWAATLQQSSDDAATDAYADIEASPTAKTKATFLAADDQDDRVLVIDLQAVERYLKLSWAKTGGTFTVSQLCARVELYGPVDTAYLGSEVDGFYL